MMETTARSTSSVKLERIKRSWTQEHLAEISGLSVRTIQRIENGEGIQAESLRLIALAMGIEPEVLHRSIHRTSFRAPWSSSLKLITSLALLLLLIVGALSLRNTPWILEGIVTLVLLCLAYSVQGYSLKEGHLWIHRPGWSKRYPLKNITEIQINPEATLGSIRLFGIGGLFANVGYFRNDILGNYHAYMTDTQKAVVIRLQGKTIVITPDDPSAFAAAVEQQLKGTQ